MEKTKKDFAGPYFLPQTPVISKEKLAELFEAHQKMGEEDARNHYRVECKKKEKK